MRKLKIFEQLLIIFSIAVLLPLCIAAFIVTNVNQHAVREEIKYSANITADNVYQRLLNSIEERKMILLYIAKSLRYIKSPDNINFFLKEISYASDKTHRINLFTKNQLKNKKFYIPEFKNSDIYIFSDVKKKSLIIYVKLKNNKYLVESVKLKDLEKNVFKYIVNDKRQVYIIDSAKNIIMSYNRENSAFKNITADLPEIYTVGEPVIFGKIKNLPNIFLKLKEPDWSIIVVTPKHFASYGIKKASFKIIQALLIAATSIIIIGIWYSYSLRTNIKQLFKAISAISMGNYKKRIRLIRGFLTPHEIYFLTNEFNNMAEKIDNSYKELTLANKKLSRLDELKSNLIDTVSHEFRTPLTCIKGYTSRLLRSDINVDEETKIKSLKAIKQQTERLSRMVEDLLVVPDIESSLIRIFIKEVDLKEIFETCILSIQQKQSRIFDFSIEENMPAVYADPDRFEQVIINLLDNAVKYSPENSEIKINIYPEGDKAIIKIQNKFPQIPQNILETLFGKFTRLDNNLTRTTRGTGLGLFIAKGLIETMEGNINLSSGKDGFEVCLAVRMVK